MPSCRAILFDFDGVLIRSIEDHHRSWNIVFRDYGVTIGWEEFAALEGQSLYWISERLCQNHGIDPSVAHSIALRKNQIYKETMQVVYYDGALQLLADLGQHFQLALVTGAHRDRLDHSADDTLLSFFDATVTADDVTSRKPSPEPFLQAATKLGRIPSECIVVENAPFGIEAAHRAGMKCVAVRSTLGDSLLSEADWIVDEIAQIRPIFENLL